MGKQPTKVKEIPAGYTKGEVRNGIQYWVKKESKPGTPPGKAPKDKTKTAPSTGSSKPRKYLPPPGTLPVKKEEEVFMESGDTIPQKPETVIYGGAKGYGRNVVEAGTQDYDVMEFPDASGNYTNKAQRLYFKKGTEEEIPTPTEQSYVDGKFSTTPTGRKLSDIRLSEGLQQIEAPVLSGGGVNLKDNTSAPNYLKPGSVIDVNAQGGQGVNPATVGTTVKGATDVFVPKKYDTTGKEIPSTNSGLQPLGTSAESKEVGRMYDTEKKPDLITSEKFDKGGLVGKIKGYADGTTRDGVLGRASSADARSGVGAMEGVVGQSDPYAAQREEQAMKEQEASDIKKAKNKATAMKAANNVGEGLGGVGSAYYASTPQATSGDATRATALGAVSQMGAIGGAIGGIAALGDKIGKPIKASSEEMDAQGNVRDTERAKMNAIGGGLLSPSKALSTRSSYDGGWTDISGEKYVKSLEAKAKSQLADVKRQNTQNKQQQALLARDAGEFNPTVDEGIDLSRAKFDENQTLQLAKGGLVGKMKMSAEMRKHHEQMCADGGEIKGKGTAKSDSIEAEVKEGSFVVPAENAELAKGIRKLYLKAPVKKANLKQEDGETVKLSNGEHLFTPEENEYLESIGIELEDLAPNAEHGEEEMAKGGLTAGKARMILHDKKVHGKPLTDKQRKFFGAISSGASIKGYAEGGDVASEEDVIDPKKERERIAKEEKAIADKKAEIKKEEAKLDAESNIKKHRENTISILSGVAKKKADLEKEYSKVISGKNPDYRTEEERRSRGKDILNEIDNYTEKLKKTAGEYELSKNKSNYNEVGEFTPKESDKKLIETKGDANLEVKPKSKQSDQTYEELIKKPVRANVTDAEWKKAVDDSIAKGDVIPKGGTTSVIKAPKTATGKAQAKAPSSAKFVAPSAVDSGNEEVIVPGGSLSPNEIAANKAVEDKAITDAKLLNESAIAAEATTTKVPSSKRGLVSTLGNIDPTAIVGIGQAVAGGRMLAGEKRPIDKFTIDRTYNAAVNRAQQEATFGLTPEQKFMAEQDIANARRDAMAQGVNYAGGSGTQAFNLNRAAINDAWKNKLGLTQADTEARMNKQKYADVMAADRAGILASNRRQAYLDATNAFQQKQQAGSELIGAGLANTIGAYRFNKEMQAQKEREGLDWSKNYNKPV